MDSNFSNPNMASNFSNPNMAGNFSNPNMAGNFNNPNMASNFSNPNMGGNFSNPNMGGNFINPNMGGNFNNPNMGGNFSNPNMAGSFSNPNMAGSFSNPNMAGNFSNPNMAGNFSNPNMASNFYSPHMAGSFGQVITNNEELRIVMVGKTGIGKSATGNTILGRSCFESKMSAKSMTVDCSKGKGTVAGQKVAVIDTPGLFDTRFDVTKTDKDISQCITYASPGPHVFLVVIKLGRFTVEEQQTVQKIQEMFGEAADRYSMVLFTGGDQLEGEETIEDYVAESKELQQLVARCNGQYHVFNNKSKDPSQVDVLLQKIRNIVQKNGGSHYTNKMFQEAERATEKEKQRILKEKEEQMRKEREQIERQIQQKYEEEMKRIQDQLQADRERDKKEREEERERDKQAMSEERKKEREEREAERARVREEKEKELNKLTEQFENELKDQKKKMEERYDTEAREEAESSNPLHLLLKAGQSIVKAGKHVADGALALRKVFNKLLE